jgi:TRAP-type uncharacterized transport system fused permease subunit
MEEPQIEIRDDEGATRRRSLGGLTGFVARWLAITMSLFHLYTGAYGTFESLLQRSIHLLFTLILIALCFSASEKKRKGSIAVVDLILIFASVVSIGYLFVNYNEIVGGRYAYATPLTTTQLILGLVLIALVLETTRRMTGAFMPLVAVVFLFYGFFGNHLPDF